MNSNKDIPKEHTGTELTIWELISQNKIKTVIIVLIIITFILLQFVIGLHYIPSGSMEPTIMTGDVVISNRLYYKFYDVERGDIIFFNSEPDGKKMLLTKRVIGLPGDTVSFVEGNVYVNGERLDESEYLPEGIITNCVATFQVPEDCYFVLGDNRESSNDSRFWAEPYVSIRAIKGKKAKIISLSGRF